MKIGVVATGHVGVVTAVTLAHLGHQVVGTDIDQEKLATLRRGRMPFYEPGAEALLKEGVESGRLLFEDSIGALADAEVTFICVGTPPRATGEASLLAVEKAAVEVARQASSQTVIVEKSTVPAGTATRVRRSVSRERSDIEIAVASNPEFLREGHAVKDSLEPDRILVGADEEWVFERLRLVYKPLVDQGVPLFETNIQTAELAKHACNAFLALKVSFANALSFLCERADADVVAVADVMGADKRIGREFLNAGMGYGGYCFPKDLVAFERLASQLGYDFALLREVAAINEEATEAVLRKVKDALWNLEDKRIALLGLAFKPETDDVRFAPALALAKMLLDEGAEVVGYDPQAGANAKAEVPDLEIVGSALEALQDTHCAVLCTEWDEFRTMDLPAAKAAMKYAVVVDGRNVFDPTTVAAAGLTYYPIGRPSFS